MPVLHIIVLDVFFIRPLSRTEPQTDVAMQQEVVAALLLKYTHNPMVGGRGRVVSTRVSWAEDTGSVLGRLFCILSLFRPSVNFFQAIDLFYTLVLCAVAQSSDIFSRQRFGNLKKNKKTDKKIFMRNKYTNKVSHLVLWHSRCQTTNFLPEI